MSATSRLPRVLVHLDGLPLRSEEGDALAAVQIRQELSLPSCCELTFHYPRPGWGEDAHIELGSKLQVALEDHSPTLFEGEVTAIEQGSGPASRRALRVRAYDVLHRLRKHQTLRHFSELRLEDLARELLAGQALDLDVHILEPGPVWPKLVQWDQSDLALLTQLSERCGLYFTVQGKLLWFISLEGFGPVVPLSLGESLLEARVDANTDPACRAVGALGWNPWRAETHRAEAARARCGRDVALEAGPATIGIAGRRTLVDEIVQSDEEAVVLAQALLDRRVAGEVTLWGIADGDPALRPGATVEVGGMAPSVCGRYVLTTVRHTIDRRRGYLSEIGTAPPVPSERPRCSISTVGVVTDVSDPEGLGRVRVALPSFGGFDSDWLEVMTPGAGPDKGLIALPDLRDRVLVLLSRQDPAQGIVLGGLFGSRPPPDTGVAEGRVRRYTFVTPGGQRLRLDDENQTVRVDNASGTCLQLAPGRARLANSSGSFVELSGSKLRIHANCDLEIDAPGHSIKMRGAAIDFETA